MLMEKINKKHISTIFNVLERVIPSLPNKKIIAWCGTIAFANKWHKIFNDNREYCKFFEIFTYCIDHSQINQNLVLDNYDKFKNLKNNSILFCADKHREGSDIPNLDCCIFIDFVKNRGAIPFIQSIGRVLRKDTNINKIQGTVIDSFITNTESYEKELVSKIIGYYISFENLSDSDLESNKYTKYLELSANTKFDVINQCIQFKLSDDAVINIDCKSLEWRDINNKFESLLQDKINLSAYDNLKSKASILITKFNFNTYSDFWTEYTNITDKDKNKYNLPNLEDDEYVNVFNNYSWFDILDIKHEFIELHELKNLLKGKIVNEQFWKIIANKNNFVPPYPQYVYKNFTFKIFNNASIIEL